MGGLDTSLGGAAGAFPETRSEFVSRLQSRAGQEDFCRRYWKPAYFYLRKAWGRSNEDAKDLTQAFLVWLLEEDVLKGYDPAKAGFRTYLKSLLKHFMLDEQKAAQRLKRGGGVRVVDVDGDLVDPGGSTPEEAFDAAWRRTLMFRAIDRVRARYQGPRSSWFRLFEEVDLGVVSPRPTYRELADRFGIKETDVHNHLFAVREDVRTEIRAELANVTAGAAELEEEWHGFMAS
jgi:RNA polymerase sigma factor (sigma-70 family)